jgi:hypothetical protein
MKELIIIATSAAVMLAGASSARAGTICTFNGQPKACNPNQGHRIPLTKGSDLDIRWADGEITTIKFLGPNTRPTRKGDKVLINGKTQGTVMFNRDVKLGVFEIGIRSSTGNSFSVKLGD